MFFSGKLGVRMMACALAFAFLIALLAACGRSADTVKEQAADPEQLRQVERLADASDEMYRLVMEGDLPKAKEKLDEIGSRMTEIRFIGIASVEGVGAMSESIVQAKRLFSSVQASEDEVKLAAAKIRLAADALTHAHQPMWLQYYRGMKDTAQKLQQAIARQNMNDALGLLEQLQRRYATIRPSVLISREPWQAEKLESLFVFMRSRLAQPGPDSKEAWEAAEQLKLGLDELFQKRDAAAFVPVPEREVPLQWVLSIGSIIAAVLAFAAWRIFQFERNSIGGGGSRWRGQ